MDECVSDPQRRFTQYTTNMTANIVPLLHCRATINLDVNLDEIGGATFPDSAFFDSLNAFNAQCVKMFRWLRFLSKRCARPCTSKRSRSVFRRGVPTPIGTASI